MSKKTTAAKLEKRVEKKQPSELTDVELGNVQGGLCEERTKEDPVRVMDDRPSAGPAAGAPARRGD